MARHGMSRVLSRSCRSIQTWLSPTSLQYPLWHFLWCEWGRIHSHPTQVVYCFCLRRLTQRPRLRTRLASLCRRPVLAGDSCHASGKTLGRQLIGHFLSGFYSWRFFFCFCDFVFRFVTLFTFLSFRFFYFFIFLFISSFPLEFTKELRRHSASSASTWESTLNGLSAFYIASEIETEEEERKTNR